MESLSNSELDAESIASYSKHISILFNDLAFQQNVISSLEGAITSANIFSLSSTSRKHERDRGKRESVFKSLCGTWLSKYEESDQVDPEAFVNFGNVTKLHNARLFFRSSPTLKPFATRALLTDMQQEEGDGYGSTSDIRSGRKGKWRNSKPFVRERLFFTFQTFSEVTESETVAAEEL